jgi:hypothetical protein
LIFRKIRIIAIKILSSIVNGVKGGLKGALQGSADLRCPITSGRS